MTKQAGVYVTWMEYAKGPYSGVDSGPSFEGAKAELLDMANCAIAQGNPPIQFAIDWSETDDYDAMQECIGCDTRFSWSADHISVGGLTLDQALAALAPKVARRRRAA